MQAVRKCAPLSLSLSAERVRDEVEKTLLSASPQTVTEMAELGLLKAVGVTGAEDLSFAAKLPPERSVRWAAFFRACPRAKWEDFRLERKTGEIAAKSAALAASDAEPDWKRLISRYGTDVGLCTARLLGAEQTVREILDAGHCLFLKDLAVSGRDFPELKGREVGNMLQKLLEHVLKHPWDNVKEILLDLSRKL